MEGQKKCPSTFKFPRPTQSIELTRKEKDESQTKVPCPVALRDYNTNMNCIDKFDHMKSIEKVKNDGKGCFGILLKSVLWMHIINKEKQSWKKIL